jgi:hypothetical protein
VLELVWAGPGKLPDGRWLAGWWLMPVCSCGWNVGMTQYGSMHDPVFNADGTLDIEASEKNPRQEWENHVARVRTINLGREALPGPLATLRELEPLEQLRAVRNLRQMVGTVEVVAVARARKDQRSWTQIGEALGVSKQSAGREVPQRRPQNTGHPHPVGEGRRYATSSRDVWARDRSRGPELGQVLVERGALIPSSLAIDPIDRSGSASSASA